MIYHVRHKSFILLQSWPGESSICWHWQVEGCWWAGPHPATHCLRWQISLQPSFCACCQASHIWRLRSGRWSHLYGAAYTTGNSTRIQLCIDPLQNRNQKLNSLACWYGNRNFLSNANGPSNHHTKFEIFLIYCWFYKNSKSNWFSHTCIWRLAWMCQPQYKPLGKSLIFKDFFYTNWRGDCLDH